MKRFLLTFVAAMTLCLGVSAQEYQMLITKSDGTVIPIAADDIKNVSFVAAEPVVDVPRHYDVTVAVGKHGGMGQDKSHLTISVPKLDSGSEIDFKNAGAEIADYSMESIIKGKYYYQVPVSADRFVKFQIVNNQVEVVKARPFSENTYNVRQYTHAWTDDNTLVIMASNGSTDKIIWTKLNTSDMTIISEGELNISLSEGYKVFTTTGILTYRQSDNKLFYFYFQKTAKRNGVNEKNFHVAVINPETMAIEQNNLCPIECEMAGSAYGELLQNISFFDEAGNLYLATFSDSSIGEEGKLLRIKKGEYNFEPDFNGFPNSDGKLLTTQYLGNGKVLTYSRHDDESLGTKIDSYAHYYSIVDLYAKTRTRLAFNGEEIPYSSGRFSQRSVVDRAAGKAYIGVNTANAQPQIYVYDIKTGEVKEGVKVAEGYYFEQIRIVED